MFKLISIFTRQPVTEIPDWYGHSIPNPPIWTPKCPIDGSAHGRVGCTECMQAPWSWDTREHCTCYCDWRYGHTDMCQASEDARLAEAWDQ